MVRTFDSKFRPREARLTTKAKAITVVLGGTEVAHVKGHHLSLPRSGCPPIQSSTAPTDPVGPTLGRICAACGVSDAEVSWPEQTGERCQACARRGDRLGWCGCGAPLRFVWHLSGVTMPYCDRGLDVVAMEQLGLYAWTLIGPDASTRRVIVEPVKDERGRWTARNPITERPKVEATSDALRRLTFPVSRVDLCRNPTIVSLCLTWGVIAEPQRGLPHVRGHQLEPTEQKRSKKPHGMGRAMTRSEYEAAELLKPSAPLDSLAAIVPANPRRAMAAAERRSRIPPPEGLPGWTQDHPCDGFLSYRDRPRPRGLGGASASERYCAWCQFSREQHDKRRFRLAKLRAEARAAEERVQRFGTPKPGALRRGTAPPSL